MARPAQKWQQEKRALALKGKAPSQWLTQPRNETWFGLAARPNEEPQHIPEKECHGSEELDGGSDVGVLGKVPHD